MSTGAPSVCPSLIFKFALQGTHETTWRYLAVDRGHGEDGAGVGGPSHITHLPSVHFSDEVFQVRIKKSDQGTAPKQPNDDPNFFFQ